MKQEPSSSSIVTTAHCGLWPVEQCPSILLRWNKKLLLLILLLFLFLLPWALQPTVGFGLSNNVLPFCFDETRTFFFFFFHWHYSPLWVLACRTMSFNFYLSATNSLLLLIPRTWRSLSTSSFHLFLGLPLLLIASRSWVKIFLGILSSSIISRWPNQLNLCPFIHFTIYETRTSQHIMNSTYELQSLAIEWTDTGRQLVSHSLIQWNVFETQPIN